MNDSYNITFAYMTSWLVTMIISYISVFHAIYLAQKRSVAVVESDVNTLTIKLANKTLSTYDHSIHRDRKSVTMHRMGIANSIKVGRQ